MNKEELKEAMEATPEWAEHQMIMHAHETACKKQRTIEDMRQELSKASSDLWSERVKASDSLWATKEHKAYWKLWKEEN
jgi:DNA helicase IV